MGSAIKNTVTPPTSVGWISHAEQKISITKRNRSLRVLSQVSPSLEHNTNGRKLHDVTEDVDHMCSMFPKCLFIHLPACTYHHTWTELRATLGETLCIILHSILIDMIIALAVFEGQVRKPFLQL